MYAACVFRFIHSIYLNTHVPVSSYFFTYYWFECIIVQSENILPIHFRTFSRERVCGVVLKSV